ncbi:MAG TPA: ATP synthase subunit I [Vicinamibacterales bacterium]|nr:ATP synthase subunit I [Vicinamibacterales bacterium]
MTPDAMLARVARRALVISAVFTAAALVAGGVNAAVGVVGGAALALMSFLMLTRGTARMADPAAGQAGRGSALGLIVVRYALLAFAAYVMIARLRLHPIGLLVGASSIAAAIAVEAATAHHE